MQKRNGKKLVGRRYKLEETNFKMSYCERAEMALLVRLLAQLLGLGQADFSRALQCAVIEFNVCLWNRIRIACCFPALMLPEA